MSEEVRMKAFFFFLFPFILREREGRIFGGKKFKLELPRVSMTLGGEEVEGGRHLRQKTEKEYG